MSHRRPRYTSIRFLKSTILGVPVLFLLVVNGGNVPHAGAASALRDASGAVPSPSYALARADAADEPTDAAADNGAQESQAETIARLQRTIDADRKQLATFQRQVDDPQSDYHRAEDEFEKLDNQLEQLKSQSEQLNRDGKTPQAEEVEKRIDSVQSDRDAARERFDLEIREHKALSEKTAALQEKIRQDSAKLRSLTVTPDSEPVAGDGMSASSDEAPQPKDTSPPSNAGAQQSEPASPAVPGLPGASTLKKAQQAEQEAKKKASEVLLQAQREAKAKEADAKHATTEVKSATERLEALQRSIKAEQEMLEVANQKADQAQHELSELNAKRQPEIAQNPQAWDALTKQIHEASDRYSEAQKQAQGSRNRLDDLQGQLVSLQQERIAALNEAEETQAAANEAQGKVDRLINPFSLKNIMQWFLDHGPKLLAILIGALILYLTVKLSGRHLVKVVARGGHRGTVRERENRALTLVGVFQNVASLVVVIGGAMMLLDEMGIPIVPLMGGAAVIGLAAAFGAQNLVKDYFSGFMLLLEDQYGLNDVVRIGDIAGVVEGITLRITTLRDLEGVVHFVPHGTITVVSNLTHGWSRALLDIGVAYQEDTDRVMDVMIEVARGMRKDKAFAPLILDNPEMLGVDALGDSAVSIKMVMKTAPTKQWAVRREYLRRIKHRFDELGIEIPFPQRTVYIRQENGGTPPSEKT